MARLRASMMVAATAAMAATGASLAYVFFTGPPEDAPQPQPPPPQKSIHHHHHLSPPPDLPLSSKLPAIPNSNFDDLNAAEEASDCDYGNFWECIVNGNVGCEVLEEDLRECLQRSRSARRT